MSKKEKPDKFHPGNKTKRNKKIKHTEPGKSIRKYKNKPINERVGPHHDNKSRKKFDSYNQYSFGFGATKRNSRSPSNILFYEIPGEPKLFNTREERGVCDRGSFSESFIKKMNRKYQPHFKNDGGGNDNDIPDKNIVSCIRGQISPSGDNLIINRYAIQSDFTKQEEYWSPSYALFSRELTTKWNQDKISKALHSRWYDEDNFINKILRSMPKTNTSLNSSKMVQQEIIKIKI